MTHVTNHPLHLFLAAPYTQWMDWELGSLHADRVEYLSILRQAFLEKGMAVFSAHHNEDWGRSWLPPEICTPADFLAVQRSDVVCALLGQSVSPGVLVELGWASAMGKPVVLLVGDDPLPQLVRGLEEVTCVEILQLPESWTSECLLGVTEAVTELASRSLAKIRNGAVDGYPSTPLPYGYHVPI